MDGLSATNYSQSDFSDASVASLGRSIQTDDLSESSYLLPGSIQTAPAERRPVGSTWYMSVFLVVNAALGAGLLNFPASYHACGGIVVAIIVQTVLAIFVIGSMLILIYCAQVHQSATYQDVVYACCGRTVRILCSITIALYAFGTCVTFFIIIGDQWDKFLSLVYGATYCLKWYMSRQFTISVSAVIFVLPMCFPRRIDFLKYTSIIGAVAVLYCVILVTVKYFIIPHDNRICPVRHRPDTWMSVFTVVPVICFGYQCHLSLVPIYACTRKRTLADFSKTIIVALALCFLTYTLTASFGYLTFGSCVLQDILSSYRPTPDVIVAVIAIAIKMYTTYPILLFVGRAALDSVWGDVRNLSVFDVERTERRRRIFLTIIWFVASLLLALFVPDIGKVISLLGSLAAIFIFVFPGMCLMQLVLDGYVNPESCWLKYAACIVTSSVCIVIGVSLFGITVTQSLMNDITSAHGHSKSIRDSVCST